MNISDHGRLALLYASDSAYDLQVQSDLANGGTVVAEQDFEIRMERSLLEYTRSSMIKTLFKCLKPTQVSPSVLVPLYWRRVGCLLSALVSYMMGFPCWVQAGGRIRGLREVTGSRSAAKFGESTHSLCCTRRAWGMVKRVRCVL